MAKLCNFIPKIPSFLHAEEWNSVYKYAGTGRFLLTPDCYRELYFVVSVASIYCN